LTAFVTAVATSKQGAGDAGRARREKEAIRGDGARAPQAGFDGSARARAASGDIPFGAEGWRTLPAFDRIRSTGSPMA
jgi:hypothetical protein